MIRLADTLGPMADFPVALAEHIQFEDGDTLQKKFNDEELGGGDNSLTITQEEYDNLSIAEQLDGLYYTYDTKRIYKNGIQYGANEPLELTMDEFKALKEAGALDEKQEYIITTNENGTLLEASDIGYNGTTSGLSSLSVQGAIDEVNDKIDNIIDDENVDENTVSTWSSKKITEKINGVISDTTSSTTSTYSSAKIDEKIVGTKIQYRGSQSIDISTSSKLTFIYSSMYASQAGCYMLLSNYNTEPLLIELGKFPQSSFNVTATNKSFGVDTITVTTASDEYSWYILQF